MVDDQLALLVVAHHGHENLSGEKAHAHTHTKIKRGGQQTDNLVRSRTCFSDYVRFQIVFGHEKKALAGCSNDVKQVGNVAIPETG